MAARVLVTGASGQLAPAVARRLIGEGFAVTLLARTRFARFRDADTVLMPERWTEEALGAALARANVDAVINLAGAGVRPGGTDAGALFDTNVALPCAMMRAWPARAGSARRAFVNIGSGAEYAGARDGAPLDESAPLTRTHPYGLSKAAAGLAGAQVAAELGIGFAHLRLFGVYGENEAAHRLLPTLVDTLRQGTAAPLSDGRQVRDWLYEEDVGDAVCAAVAGLLGGGMPSGVYNLGSGEGASVRRFAETVADHLNAPRVLLRFGAIGRRGAEEDALVADARRLRDATGWNPRYGLDAGLAEAVARLARATPRHEKEGAR